MNNIIGVYKITNTITGDFYIGSSKDVKRRWASHKCTSTWNKCKNNPMYLDMRKYGTDKFAFEVFAEVEVGNLKEMEQQFIETLKPTYNNRNSKGWDVERYKEWNNKYKNQLCSYNGEKLTLNALYQRFEKQGIQHPAQEAKKYLLGGCND